MTLTRKIATGAVAGILSLAVTGTAASAAFVPAETVATAGIQVADDTRVVAERGDKGKALGTLEAVLDRLVANGTITAEQKAKIVEALRPRPDTSGRHLKEIWAGAMRFSVEYLGLPAEDVKAALRSGQSLGQLADATAGKTRQGLIDHLVAAITLLIDQGVTDERITAEQAERFKAGLLEKVTKFVDHVYAKKTPREGAKEKREAAKERAKELKETFKERAKELKERFKERREALKERERI